MDNIKKAKKILDNAIKQIKNLGCCICITEHDDEKTTTIVHEYYGLTEIDVKESFDNHLKECSKRVSYWPKWKQNLLGGTA